MTAPDPAEPPAEPAPLPNGSSYGWPFWVASVAGIGVMAWGVVGFLDAVPANDERWSFGVWLVGSDVLHDLLLVPAVLAIGWLVARLVPPRVQPPLEVGLVLTGIVLVLAWLPLTGSADHVGNPTIQPLDYGTATATVLAVTWAGVLVWALLRRRGGEPPAPPADRSEPADHDEVSGGDGPARPR